MGSTDLETLHAHVCAAYFRSLRIGALRGLAVVSLALWYQGLTRIFPALVAWFPGLGAALLAALGVTYGALECRWGWRGRRAHDPGCRFVPEPSRGDEFRAGLLCAWGVLALAPTAAALGSSAAESLLPALFPVALAVLAAWAGWEYAERVKARRPAARATRA